MLLGVRGVVLVVERPHLRVDHANLAAYVDERLERLGGGNARRVGVGDALTQNLLGPRIGCNRIVGTRASVGNVVAAHAVDVDALADENDVLVEAAQCRLRRNGAALERRNIGRGVLEFVGLPRNRHRSHRLDHRRSHFEHLGVDRDGQTHRRAGCIEQEQAAERRVQEEVVVVERELVRIDVHLARMVRWDVYEHPARRRRRRPEPPAEQIGLVGKIRVGRSTIGAQVVGYVARFHGEGAALERDAATFRNGLVARRRRCAVHGYRSRRHVETAARTGGYVVGYGAVGQLENAAGGVDARTEGGTTLLDYDTPEDNVSPGFVRRKVSTVARCDV